MIDVEGKLKQIYTEQPDANVRLEMVEELLYTLAVERDTALARVKELEKEVDYYTRCSYGASGDNGEAD